MCSIPTVSKLLLSLIKVGGFSAWLELTGRVSFWSYSSNIDIVLLFVNTVGVLFLADVTQRNISGSDKTISLRPKHFVSAPFVDYSLLSSDEGRPNAKWAGPSEAKPMPDSKLPHIASPKAIESGIALVDRGHPASWVQCKKCDVIGTLRSWRRVPHSPSPTKLHSSSHSVLRAGAAWASRETKKASLPAAALRQVRT